MSNKIDLKYIIDNANEEYTKEQILIAFNESIIPETEFSKASNYKYPIRKLDKYDVQSKLNEFVPNDTDLFPIMYFEIENTIEDDILNINFKLVSYKLKIKK